MTAAPKEKSNPLAPIMAIILKSGKLLASLKVIKPLFSIVTMFISMLAYSPRLGFECAVVFVLLVMVHECGHAIALMKLGFKASVPIFIPFLGAVIFAPNLGDLNQEAIVGIGGPLAGFIGTAILSLFLALTNSHDANLWVAVILSSFINLIDLIPVRPLDGGRITAIIGVWVSYVGMALAVAGLFVFGSSFAYLLALLLISQPYDARLRVSAALLLLADIWLARAFNIMHPQSEFVCCFDSILFLLIATFDLPYAFILARVQAPMALYTRVGPRCLPWQRPDLRMVYITYPEAEVSNAPRAVKARWLVAYLALGVVLFVMFAWQSSVFLTIIPPKH